MLVVLAIAILLAQAGLPSPPPPITSITSSPLSPDSPENATIDFSFKPCSRADGQSFTGGIILYSIWSRDVRSPGFGVEKKFAWNSNDPKPLHWSVRVPPGVYSYEVEAVHRAAVDRMSVFCSSYFYVAALPRSTRRITETMYEGLGDPIPRVYVYGVAPKGSEVSVVRFDGKPDCGDSLTAESETPLAAERDAVGYYASESYVPGDASTRPIKGVVLGVRVKMPGSNDVRTFRVVTDYPNSIVQDPPISARFDLTSEMIQAAFDRPGNALVCT